MPIAVSALERMRHQQEIGKDKIDIVGDEMIMKDADGLQEDARHTAILKELGIKTIDVSTIDK